MKKFCLISGLFCTITLTVLMSVLLVLAIVDNSKYKIEKSIVYIDTEEKQGMGFVYKVEDNISYIVTNYHVIDLAQNIYINDELKAEIVEYDKYSDIAILKVNKKLKTAIINENDALDNIYYYNINNNSIEQGSIVSLDNEITINATYGASFYNAIEINGNIEEGNSGSPLLNTKREVIGLISLKDVNNKTSYVLPIDYVMKIVNKLENHNLYRPNLGATFINTTNIEKLNEYSINTFGISGVVVLDVKESYPLYVSELYNGDIITKINEINVTDVNSLQKELYSHNFGEDIYIEYYREGVANIAVVNLNK